MLTITGGQEAPDIPEGHMQTTILCKRQGSPNTLTRIPKFRKREYCSDICKQIAYRERKAQLISNTRQLQDRIRELEERVQVLEAAPSLRNASAPIQRFNILRHIYAGTHSPGTPTSSRDFLPIYGYPNTPHAFSMRQNSKPTATRQRISTCSICLAHHAP